MKKIFKNILKVLLIPIILFTVIYLFLNVSYLLNKKTFVETFDVQGNKNGYVPQGLAFSSKHNVILQTSYNKKNVSLLYITDFNSGKLLKTLKIKNNEIEYNHNHVGGIATNNDKVWITNDYKVYEYSLEDIMYTDKDYIISTDSKDLYNRGDYCFYKDNILWIGDFHNPIYMQAKDNNPLLLGYEVKDKIDYNKPQYAISTPSNIQGMTMLDDNSIVFTTSFSNLLRSKILVYSNILENESKDYYLIDNNRIPYYELTKKELKKKISTSPMAEGLFYKSDHLYILFENSSDEYEFTYPKIRKIVKYKIN